MRHLGIHLYYWNQRAPKRLVTELLKPLASELRGEGAVTHFWFTLFDTRAPHVFGLFAVPDPARFEPTRDRLHQAASAYLSRFPVEIDITAAEVVERHEQCRGKILSAVDTEPGIAEPNTVRTFEQGTADYPFSPSYDTDERWKLWRRSMDWVLESLEGGRQTLAAVCWVASVARALDRFAPELSEGYWRHHACSLVYPLSERLRQDEQGVLNALPETIGGRNMEVFEGLWASGISAAAEPAEGLLRALLAADEDRIGPVLDTLRDINHNTLAQLFQQVRFHIPLVLFAWWRACRREVCHV